MNRKYYKIFKLDTEWKSEINPNSVRYLQNIVQQNKENKRTKENEAEDQCVEYKRMYRDIAQSTKELRCICSHSLTI
jgi:tRNA G37 N-methylase Trm5